MAGEATLSLWGVLAAVVSGTVSALSVLNIVTLRRAHGETTKTETLWQIAFAGLAFKSAISTAVYLIPDRAIADGLSPLVFPGTALFCGTCAVYALSATGALPATARWPLWLIVAEPSVMLVGAALQLRWNVLFPMRPWTVAHIAYCSACLALGAVCLLGRRGHGALQGLRPTGRAMAVGSIAIAVVFALQPGGRPTSPWIGLGYVATFALASLTLKSILNYGLLFRLRVIPRARVMDRIDLPVLVFDRARRLSDANAAAFRLHGRSVDAPELVIGALDRDVLDEPLPDGSRQVLRVFPFADGTRAEMELAIRPLLNRRGRRTGWTVVAQDVTQSRALHRRMETELQLAHQTESLLKRQASLDALTGLGNRRELGLALGQAVGHAHASGTALSFIMCDIDHFKQVNDTWGHQVGDQALQSLARVLRAATRSTDAVARYGGEEFAVVLPGADLGAARTIAESIRATVAVTPVAALPGGPLTLTVSMGVAILEPGMTPTALIRSADRALYEAKNAGRNRVAPAGGAALSSVATAR